MKYCPQCGSAHIGPLAFYRPSIWKCQDCDYEGAFIIEMACLDKLGQERHIGQSDIVPFTRDSVVDGWDESIKDRWRPLGPT